MTPALPDVIAFAKSLLSSANANGAVANSTVAADKRPIVLRFMFFKTLVDVVQRVVDVELASRRDERRVLDYCFEFTRLVINDHDCRLLFLATPD